MIVNSIRWRLQIWHGLLLVIVLCGFGLTAYRVAYDAQWRRIDRELTQKVESIFRPPNQQFRPPPRPNGDPQDFRRAFRDLLQERILAEVNQPNGTYVVYWPGDGPQQSRSPGSPGEVPRPEKPEPLRRGPGPPGFYGERSRADLREVFVYLPGGDCLLAGRSVAPDLAFLQRLLLTLVAAGCGVLALGLAGGWWLASRAIQPIEAISETAVRIAAGDLSQRIGVEETESELGRLAAVLNSTFARLEASFTHQARFTSDASHELRTPISVILTQTQSALARERPASEYREALEACQRAAQRMRRLTESLLELSRMDAGEEVVKRDRFDMSRVARDSVELVRPLAEARGIQIICDLPTVECAGNSERIGQVALNLLTNAVHFNREGGEVRIATHTENGSACLAVRDTGEGIPSTDVPHIFERFYRVDKSRSRIQGRTGLGLAICKAVVDAHGGSIDVATEPGIGSTFTVKLPRG